ncbi:ectopic P granules protein 5 homolog [Anopheles maculipalpis]|uniref:ectopic P granules protein 5 homolog n=1 Tax=Anopheles maculipalpis TaxID=1496333 RepID=UPI002158D97B|nr:ectopic P granules protein 5 homolog [Anopheles maculipalpis]
MEEIKRKKKRSSKAAKKQEKQPSTLTAAASPPPVAFSEAAAEEAGPAVSLNEPEELILPDAVQELAPPMEDTKNSDEMLEETDLLTDFKPTAPICGDSDKLPSLLYPDLRELNIGSEQFDSTFSNMDITPKGAISSPEDDYECVIDEVFSPRISALFEWCIEETTPSLERYRRYADGLERQFITTEGPHAKNTSDDDSDLQRMLQAYRSSYHYYCDVMIQRLESRSQISSLRDKCWDIEHTKVTEFAQCADSRLLSVSVNNRVATLNVERCTEAKAELSALLDRFVTKEKEALIQLHYTRAMVEKNLSDPSVPGYEQSGLLRCKLRIIGNALRAEMHQRDCDKGDECQYVQDLRKWFIQLGTGILRAGSVDERVWLMFHLLRFPKGIGTWAHVLVHPLAFGNQNEPLTNIEIHTIFTLIHVLIRPIIARQSFVVPVDESLATMDQPPLVNEAKAGDDFEWVDSDGEDSSADKRIRPIKESDLLAFLDQIPFRRLFDTVLQRTIEHAQHPDGEQLNPDHLPTADILHLFSFSNELIAILGGGLLMYGRGIARYSHFAQRLALLINDAVKFVGDVLRLYRQAHKLNRQSEESEVVQVHFDTLMYRAVLLIHGGGVALTRHLSTLPFGLLSTCACWWIYATMVNRSIREKPDFDYWKSSHRLLNNCTLMEEFEQQLAKKKSSQDLYNLLKPLVDLALTRDATKDGTFIPTVAATLIELLAAIPADAVVFVEMKDQIHLLMERTSSVLSFMLNTLALEDENRRQTIANCWEMKGNTLLEVFSGKKQLIMRWRPDHLNYERLIYMLLEYPRTHIYHKLSLGLLMYIQYGDTSPFIVPVQKDLQNIVAYNIVVAYRKHQPVLNNSNGGGPSVAVTAEQQAEHRSYQERCLFLLLQLHIHAFDQPMQNIRRFLEDPSQVEEVVLPLSVHAKELQRAIKEQCPVACLCALLSTKMGHWVPVFCQEGLKAMRILYEVHHLDTVVVRCLELISLLFTDCPHALAKNDQFIGILTELVENDNILDWSRQTGDEQHHTLAMKLLEGASMGKMGSMIVSQAAMYWHQGYATPPSLVCMWFDWLVKIKNWSDSVKVLRLMNVLASISFRHADAWKALGDRFRPFFESIAVVKHKQHSLWSKIVGTEPPLLYGKLPNDCVALALLVFGIEHQQLEQKTGLWLKLLRMLKKNRTIKIDAALREVMATTCVQGKDSCPTADALVLFKVARYLLRANTEHPLYLGLWQLFFTLLLTRVTDVGDEVHGVADRLYDHDSGLMEKLKQLLCKLELHYHFLQETNEDSPGMLRLVKAFQLWLVDTDLNQINDDAPIKLPKQYATEQLESIFYGLEIFWPECTNTQILRVVHRMMIEGWHNLYRVLPHHSSAKDKTVCGATIKLPPTQAIKRRLENSYTDPLPIPVSEHRTELKDLADALKTPPMGRVKRITECVRIIKQHIDKTYLPMKNELKIRQNELFELYQQLYVNEDMETEHQVKCNMLICSGAATIMVRSKCVAIDTKINTCIEARLVALEAFLNQMINVPPYIMKHTIMLRELGNSLFMDYCSEIDRASAQTLNEAIRAMIRTLLHEVSDANFEPPLTFAVRLGLDTYRSDFFNIMLEEVGQIFAGALEDGRKPSSVIVAMLENSHIPVRPLMKVYGQLVKQKSGNLERSIFVDLFGNKLHLSKWLKQQHSITPDEVDQFASLIMLGMYKSRPADSVGPPRSVDQTELDVQFSHILLSHLEIFASYQFPDNFGKMVQHTLNAYSQWPTLPPTMLLRLLNVLRSRANLPDLQISMEDSALCQAHRQFAEVNCTEPVLSFEVLELVIVTVTEHFARQRDIAYPWNGMYKRHGAYVEVLGMLLGLLSHSFLTTGMQDNRIRAVQEHLLPAVYRMFEPWVIPYDAETPVLQQGRFSSNHPSSPKESSNRHANNDNAKWMFSVLLQTVEYALEKVLVAYADTDHGSQILLYFLHWYVEWFVNARIMISALYVLNTLVLDLPWDRLQPSEMLIERMHFLFEHHTPECHELLACVFVRCNWTMGAEHGPLPVWLQRTHAATLAICVRLAYEPVIRSDVKVRAAMVQLLQYFAGLTWESLHVAELTPALDWFVMTGDASSMLRTTKAPCRELDDALIRFLEVVAGMRINEANRLVPGGMQLLKRKLHISVIVRMLMNAGRVSGGGKEVENVRLQLSGAFKQLLTAISAVLEGLPQQQQHMGTDNPRDIEARAMMAELLTSIKKWQTESTLSLFVDELIAMLENDTNSPLLIRCVFESAKLLDSPTEHWMRLLESALSHYLRSRSDVSWLQALHAIGHTTIDRWQFEMLFQHSLTLCLELYFLHRWHQTRGDPVAQRGVLNSLEMQVLEPVECQLYPFWCSIIYALLSVQPEPHETIRTVIGLLGDVSENNTFWMLGVLKKIFGKEKAQGSRTSHCLIAYALAALLADAYARRTPPEQSSETDDYSDADGSTEPFTLKKLLIAPEKRASRQRIATTAMEHFKSACSASVYKEHQSRIIDAIVGTRGGERELPHQILQQAKDIIVVLDSLAEPFLNTLQEAIIGDMGGI